MNDTEKINSVKKVLIFTPTLGLNPNPNEYQASLLSVINQIQGCKLGLAYFPTYRQLWHAANNQAWNTAFQYNFDYILRIDDDVHEIPLHAFSTLLEADKDVIGAAYPARRWPYQTCAMNRSKDKSLMEIWLTDDMCLDHLSPKTDAPEDQIVPCDLIGFGMTLIKTEPFKFLQRPLYLGNEDCPDDTYFAQLCMDNGVKQYVHFGVRLAHAHVNYNNAGFLFQAELKVRLEQMKEDALKYISEEEYNKRMKEEIQDVIHGKQLVSNIADK